MKLVSCMTVNGIFIGAVCSDFTGAGVLQYEWMDKWGFRQPLCTNRLSWARMVRWMTWHFLSDTEFEVRALDVWGYRPVTEAPNNIEYLRVETWRPEWCSKPRSPTFQAGSSNHCTRGPSLVSCKCLRKSTSGRYIAVHWEWFLAEVLGYSLILSPANGKSSDCILFKWAVAAACIARFLSSMLVFHMFCHGSTWDGWVVTLWEVFESGSTLPLMNCLVVDRHSAARRQTAVTAYFSSNQLLLFVFARRHRCLAMILSGRNDWWKRCQ